jgi:hypothetical protein
MMPIRKRNQPCESKPKTKMKTLPAYQIVKNSSGERAIKFGPNFRNIVTADIAGLCTGKDKWLSEIKCKCRDCKQEYPLSQLQGGGQWCQDCQDASILAES